MNRWLIVFLVLPMVLIAISCLGPGLVTDVGDKDTPDPDPQPQPATPTSWYIRHHLPGIWNYVFEHQGVDVQMYWVDQKVDPMGNLTFLFYTSRQLGTPVFRSEGAIDMKTGDFRLQSSFGSIGGYQGSILYEGTFNTETFRLDDYVCDLRYAVVGEDLQFEYVTFSISAIRSGY